MINVADVINYYEDRYTAFLDLLGFKHQVEIAERNSAELAKLHEILGVVKESLGENPKIGFRRNYFSDCIVLSADRTHVGLAEMLQSIKLLTTNMLQYDVLVRGGLTAGGAHHSREFIYGTAVNRAYLLERECARNPLTLVSEEVLEDAEKYHNGFLGWFKEDGPKRYFVHYLIEYAAYRPEPIYAGKWIMDDPGARTVDFICQRLNRDTGSVLGKAEWFQAYWNETVAVHGIFGRIERGVTERYISNGPIIAYRRMAG
jgi:hypothetical protein